MIVKDKRDGYVLPNQCVAVLRANEEVGKREMKRFYKLDPQHLAYNVMARPQPTDRLVLQRGDEEENHYIIIPRQPWHEVTVVA